MNFFQPITKCVCLKEWESIFLAKLPNYEELDSKEIRFYGEEEKKFFICKKKKMILFTFQKGQDLQLQKMQINLNIIYKLINSLKKKRYIDRF